MADIVQADIFFFVTTIAVVVITGVLVVTFYFVIKAIQEIRAVVRTVQDELEDLVEKRRNFEVQMLTIKNVVSAMVKGGAFFRNRRDNKYE